MEQKRNDKNQECRYINGYSIDAVPLFLLVKNGTTINITGNTK